MDPATETERQIPEAVAIGALELWPPVILAPMAGVTDAPFRALCKHFARAGLGAESRAPAGGRRRVPGLFVSEMITARPLVEGSRKTERLASFGADESPRSLQLYGIDPVFVRAAVERLVGEGRVDHIDMNFGCPVPKITRRGGGSAIPAKPRLLAKIVAAAVAGAAGAVPVTIKFRKGIDDGLITFRDAGRVAQEEGCAAVGLHARTAIEFYEDGADWSAIAELSARLSIPVFGNGDIWEAHDASRMMAQTGCAGVIIGRGCLGRPWLFRELAQHLGGAPETPPPAFGVITKIMVEHARAMVEWSGEEANSMRAFRKHASWYTKGFRGSANLRETLMQVGSLEDLEAVLARCDPDEPFPKAALRAVRGKRGRQRRVILPAGYRDELDDDSVPEAEAGALSSGG